MAILEKVSIVLMLAFVTSCGFLYKPKLVIGKEVTPEYLQRLVREHGSGHSYYFISSNTSLVRFRTGNGLMREQVSNYAIDEIKKSGICKSDPVLDKTGSWFDERNDIYINFFCR